MTPSPTTRLLGLLLPITGVMCLLLAGKLVGGLVITPQAKNTPAQAEFEVQQPAPTFTPAPVEKTLSTTRQNIPLYRHNLLIGSPEAPQQLVLFANPTEPESLKIFDALIAVIEPKPSVALAVKWTSNVEKIDDTLLFARLAHKEEKLESYLAALPREGAPLPYPEHLALLDKLGISFDEARTQLNLNSLTWLTELEQDKTLAKQLSIKAPALFANGYQLQPTAEAVVLFLENMPDTTPEKQPTE